MLISPSIALKLMSGSQRSKGTQSGKAKAVKYSPDLVYKLSQLPGTPDDSSSRLYDPTTGEMTAESRRLLTETFKRERQEFIKKYGFDPDKFPAKAAQIRSQENQSSIAGFIRPVTGLLDTAFNHVPMNMGTQWLIGQIHGKEAADSLKSPVTDLVSGTMNLPYDVAQDLGVLVHPNAGGRDKVGAVVNTGLKAFPGKVAKGAGKTIVKAGDSIKRIAPQVATESYYRSRVGAVGGEASASVKKGLRQEISKLNTAEIDSREFSKAFGEAPATKPHLRSPQSFANWSLKSPENNERLTLGTLKPAGAKELEQKIGVNLTGAKIKIHSKEIRHTISRHGNEKGGQVSVTTRDFSLVNDIIQNPDRIEIRKKPDGTPMTSPDGKPEVLFMKQIGNRYRVAAVTYEHSQRKARGEIKFTSMWIHK